MWRPVLAVLLSHQGRRSTGAPVTFAAAPGVTISGGTNGFAISGKSHITVRGFKVTGTTSYGISVSGSSNITIRGKTVTYSGQPVSGKIAAGSRLSNVSSSTVADNTADHNSDLVSTWRRGPRA